MARAKNPMKAVRDAIQNYFELRDSSPLAMAYDWSMLPDEVLNPFFDTCISFLHEIANRECYDAVMKSNKRYARKILDLD